MRCDPWCLILSCFIASAARPSHFASITSDLTGELRRGCPQEAPLRQVLLGLGLEEEKLTDLRDVNGVKWYGCEVVEIDFSGHTELEGSLSKGFLELKTLKHLSLSGTSVSGDLQVLKKCTELLELALLELGVTGKLEELEKARKIKSLDLGGTKVVGNLKALEHLVELDHLDLSETYVSGDLEDLPNATELRYLYLSETKVEGNVKALQKFTKLENLDLENTKISGDMSSLREATGLEDVDISGTRITGTKCLREEHLLRQVLLDLGLKDEEVSDLHDVEGVQWHGCDVFAIILSGTERQGSLSPQLQQLPKLQYLNLSGTEVSGDLAVLSNSRQLIMLDLSKSKVAGNIRALENATRLKELKVSETKILGEMASLRNTRHLEKVDTSGTAIRGTRCSRDEDRARQLFNDLGLTSAELTDVRNMDGFWWTDCDIVSITLKDRDLQGSLSPALCELPKLHTLNLAGNEISGDLRALSSCKSVRMLALGGNKITGDLEALRNLTQLMTLSLSHSQVTGNLNDLNAWLPNVHHLHLSHTKVNGSLSDLTINGLRMLSLAHTKVTGGMKNLGRAIQSLKNLMYLDISGIVIGGSARSLSSESLVTLKAAGCGIGGRLDDESIIGFPKLVTLDLASNWITDVWDVPSHCRKLVLADNPTMSFKPGFLYKAMEKGVFVNLRNVNVTSRTEALYLLDRGIVKRSGGRTVHPDRGFACYEVVAAPLEVSPEKFAPERLCTCMPGWTGAGAECAKCPVNTFKENFSETSNECTPCPSGSTAEAGSTTYRSCMCNPGKLHRKKDGSLACGCPAHEALELRAPDEAVCVQCSERNLECTGEGSDVLLAQPKAGFYRLSNQTRAVQCLEPKDRCTPERTADADVSARDTCQSNYSGAMCMDCAERFYASGKRCEKCIDAQIPHAVLPLLVVVLALSAALAGFIWSRRGSEVHEIPCLRSTLLQQLKAQAPLLLQMCQLWCVLAALATETKPKDLEDGEDKAKPSFWEIPYVEVLQLSLANLKGALNLQCRFDGPTVRFVSALAAPVFPLVALLCCLLAELVKPGLGITAALQALTLFYVGGASSISTLLSCQRKDGQGEALPEAFAFRGSMPYILCKEETALKSQVDLVGYSASFIYVLVIPFCLCYLYWRQRVVLQGSGTTTWVPAPGNDGLHVRVFSLEPCTSTAKMLEHTSRLVAAAAACIAVLYRGRVEVRIADQAAMVRPLDAARGSMEQGDLLDIFETEGARALKCRAIAKMLTERAILKDALPRDRILSGANNLLQKYALGRTIWMEIVQKLVAVALVAIVSNIEGAMMPVSVTLVMAVTSAMVQPYVQPQVNTLHCFSFLCLAVSAASFAFAEPWPGRIALAAPFALSALQALRPDSAEALAIRLWQDLDRQMDALERQEVIEVTVETYRFL